MNRKVYRHISLILLPVVCISMTACKSAIPELPEEEMKLVTDYMADTAWVHSENYTSNLYAEDEIDSAIEEEKKIKEEIKKQEQEEAERKAEEEAERIPDELEIVEPDGQKIVDSSIEDLVGIEGIEIDYLSFRYMDKYPENEDVVSFAMTPRTGMKFLVASFNVSNVSGNDLDVDFFSSGCKFRMRVNDSVTYDILATFLPDDMSIYDGVIPVESGVELCLITEIPAETEVSSLSLNVLNTKTGGNGTVSLE